MQYCEQNISTLCSGQCIDLTNNIQNCGACGFDCGPNALFCGDSGICQCEEGWYGEREQTLCGDGSLAGAEAMAIVKPMVAPLHALALTRLLS